MRYLALATTLLALVSLAACTSLPATPTPTPAPTPTAASNATEEAEVRDLVEKFGKRLQNISLQSPAAAKVMQKQYGGLVAPSLLDGWMKDPLNAPGRMVSSPWPDRIEIATMAKEAPDRYVVTGVVIEVTSVELLQGGAAAEIPVRIVAERDQGQWLITEYAEQH